VSRDDDEASCQRPDPERRAQQESDRENERIARRKDDADPRRVERSAGEEESPANGRGRFCDRPGDVPVGERFRLKPVARRIDDARSPPQVVIDIDSRADHGNARHENQGGSSWRMEERVEENASPHQEDRRDRRRLMGDRGGPRDPARARPAEPEPPRRWSTHADSASA
jgi:hypothetical protein